MHIYFNVTIRMLRCTVSQLEFISRGVLVAIAQVEGASLTAAFANADALSRASAFSSLASPHLTPPHFLVLIPCENYEDTGRLTMTQRLFEQLDRLERGARVEDHPPREAYNESSADYSAYEGNRLHGEPQAGYYGHYEPVHEPYVEEPLTFDAFGTLRYQAECDHADMPQMNNCSASRTTTAVRIGRRVVELGSRYHQPPDTKTTHLTVTTREVSRPNDHHCRNLRTNSLSETEPARHCSTSR